MPQSSLRSETAPVNENFPGKAEFLASKLTGHGYACPHYPKFKNELRNFPGRLGLFHQNKEAVCFLDVHKLCTTCLQEVVPGYPDPKSYNVWLSGRLVDIWHDHDHRATSSTHKKEPKPAWKRITLYQAGNFDSHSILSTNHNPWKLQGSKGFFAPTIMFELADEPEITTAWKWLQESGKPFYVEELNISKRKTPWLEKLAAEDCSVTKVHGYSYDTVTRAENSANLNGIPQKHKRGGADSKSVDYSKLPPGQRAETSDEKVTMHCQQQRATSDYIKYNIERRSDKSGQAVRKSIPSTDSTNRTVTSRTSEQPHLKPAVVAESERHNSMEITFGGCVPEVTKPSAPFVPDFGERKLANKNKSGLVALGSSTKAPRTASLPTDRRDELSKIAEMPGNYGRNPSIPLGALYEKMRFTPAPPKRLSAATQTVSSFQTFFQNLNQTVDVLGALGIAQLGVAQPSGPEPAKESSEPARIPRHKNGVVSSISASKTRRIDPSANGIGIESQKGSNFLLENDRPKFQKYQSSTKKTEDSVKNTQASPPTKNAPRSTKTRQLPQILQPKTPAKLQQAKSVSTTAKPSMPPSKGGLQHDENSSREERGTKDMGNKILKRITKIKSSPQLPKEKRRSEKKGSHGAGSQKHYGNHQSTKGEKPTSSKANEKKNNGNEHDKPQKKDGKMGKEEGRTESHEPTTSTNSSIHNSISTTNVHETYNHDSEQGSSPSIYSPQLSRASSSSSSSSNSSSGSSESNGALNFDLDDYPPTDSEDNFRPVPQDEPDSPDSPHSVSSDQGNFNKSFEDDDWQPYNSNDYGNGMGSDPWNFDGNDEEQENQDENAESFSDDGNYDNRYSQQDSHESSSQNSEQPESEAGDDTQMESVEGQNDDEIPDFGNDDYDDSEEQPPEDGEIFDARGESGNSVYGGDDMCEESEDPVEHFSEEDGEIGIESSVGDDYTENNQENDGYVVSSNEDDEDDDEENDEEDEEDNDEFEEGSDDEAPDDSDY